LKFIYGKVRPSEAPHPPTLHHMHMPPLLKLILVHNLHIPLVQTTRLVACTTYRYSIPWPRLYKWLH